MYRTHFGLKKVPFSIGLDPQFLWLGEKHKKTLAALRSAVLENKGFIALTGEVGTGKTSLIRGLLAGLSGEIVSASIENPGLSDLELLNVISNELGMAAAPNPAGFQIEFHKFLESVNGSGKRVLIVIDEAQRLSSGLLEEIRVVFDIGANNRKRVNVLFVGLVEFDRILADPSNRALRDQIALSCRLSPLNPEETGAYIRHRLEVAGARKELFTEGAVQDVFHFSKGIPRLVNILCDRALVSGYLRKLAMIDPELIRECAAKLDMASVAAATDIDPAPRAEPEAGINATRDRPAAGITPKGAGRKWPAAAAIGGVGLLLFALFLTRAPQNNLPQAPISPRTENTAASRPTAADPKDASPGAAQKDGEGRKAPALAEKTFYLAFKPLSADLEDDSYLILRLAAAFLAENPDSEITLICRPARDDLPFLRDKLAQLRATSIKTALAAQPNFKGMMTVVRSDEQEVGSKRGAPAGADSSAPAELRIRPKRIVREKLPKSQDEE